ncbi:hypothetical protein V1477_008411 [Vespula maculifrons]|uniref:Uncharacterized protein n=1 Tax=Vespula maculifrons TaxID=7453 RepID=A0ABD2CCZ4_VESMC
MAAFSWARDIGPIASSRAFLGGDSNTSCICRAAVVVSAECERISEYPPNTRNVVSTLQASLKWNEAVGDIF